MAAVCDITVTKLAVVFELLDPLPPVTVELSPPTKRRPNQKAHMYWWFLSQKTEGNGGYSRIIENQSSQRTYNRLQTVPGMLWIAEALGEDEKKLREAFAASEAFEKRDPGKRCAAFRELIPWARIAELLHDPSGWRIDPALKPHIAYWKGDPYIKPDSKKACKEIIDKELA